MRSNRVVRLNLSCEGHRCRVLMRNLIEDARNGGTSVIGASTGLRLMQGDKNTKDNGMYYKPRWMDKNTKYAELLCLLSSSSPKSEVSHLSLHALNTCSLHV
jgi:hypothetical protein